ncbi:RluA family pseudouridine synthase [Campylobacter sp. 7477a]|uniref:RluA family pseudouridine synthase n=1 Tax=Campylobacter sp. 7477a TaxID=2735741 RepID=UPI0030156989|nr:RluA family pseudouridine synthase [Campylobacter sp. 7477a]
MVEVIITCADRLDVSVANELKISRNQASKLIKDALVKVNSKTILKPSFLTSLQDKISINFGEAKEIKNEFEVNFDIPIIYEDEDLLVLNKPPHIVVHGAPSVKEATLVEWLNDKGYMLSNLNGDVRAGIVHRLDKGTSGAIVVAKNNTAHAALSEQLNDKSMGRIYLALTDLPLKQNCIIDRAIGRNSSNRLKKAVVSDGKSAKSAFLNLVSNDGLNLIAAKLFTGRTHQIRVHLASINRHILGDDLYGFKSEKSKINRVMLHAYMLYFIHPRTGEMVEFIAPLYDDFKNLLDKKISKELLDEKICPKFINASFGDTSSWLCI